MDAIHNRRDRFRANLDHLDAEGQFDAVLLEVQETFGRFDSPDQGRGIWWELDLHGITAQGASEEEAIAHWKKLAAQAAADGGAVETQTWLALIPAIGELRPVPVEIPADTTLADLEAEVRARLPEAIRTQAPILGLHRQLATPAPPPAAFRLGDPRLRMGPPPSAPHPTTPPHLMTAATKEHG